MMLEVVKYIKNGPYVFLVILLSCSCASNNMIRIDAKIIDTKLVKATVRTNITNKSNLNKNVAKTVVQLAKDTTEKEDGKILFDDRHGKSSVDIPIKQGLNNAKLTFIGYSDINDIIYKEIQKDLIGCDDVTCYSEIAGALGARYLLSYDLSGVDVQVKKSPDTLIQAGISGLLFATSGVTSIIWFIDSMSNSHKTISDQHPTQQQIFIAQQENKPKVNHMVYGTIVAISAGLSLVFAIWELAD